MSHDTAAVLHRTLGVGVRVKRRSGREGPVLTVGKCCHGGGQWVFSTRAAGILELVFLLCSAQHVGLDFIAVT